MRLGVLEEKWILKLTSAKVEVEVEGELSDQTYKNSPRDQDQEIVDTNFCTRQDQDETVSFLLSEILFQDLFLLCVM